MTPEKEQTNKTILFSHKMDNKALFVGQGNMSSIVLCFRNVRNPLSLQFTVYHEVLQLPVTCKYPLTNVVFWTISLHNLLPTTELLYPVHYIILTAIYILFC